MVDTAQVAFRVIVEPVDVAYTTSSPMRSTGLVPAFVSPTSSSDAEGPPVSTSEISSVDVGHETAATPTGCPPAVPSGRRAAATSEAVARARNRAIGRATGPARRARDIDVLRAGCRFEPAGRPARVTGLGQAAPL